MHIRKRTGAAHETEARRVRRVALFRSLLVSAASIAVACSVFEPPSGAADGGPDSSAGGGGGIAGGGGAGGTDASAGTGGTAGADAGPVGPWWPYTNADSCQSEGVPSDSDRPTTGSGGASNTITLAFSRLRFGDSKDDPQLTPDSNAWQDIGFDLDKTCTGSNTCKTADGGTVQEQACKNDTLLPFDGHKCRDNELGKLFPIAALSPQTALFGFSELDWNCSLWRGEFSLILRVSDYNGQPNDDSVRVDLYTSIGLKTLPNWTCTSGVDGGVPNTWSNQPQWLKSQHWTVAKRSIALNATDAGTDLPISKYADPAAYVRNGYLFARLPSGTEFWLDGQRAHVPGFRILLRRAVLVGKLSKQQDGTWKISNGTIGGVVLPSDVLKGFREIGFCENMCTDYQTVTGYLNTHQDSLSTTSQKLPNTPCDSLSIGIAFEALEATADAGDLVSVQSPVDCPEPSNPNAPRQGCVCPDPSVGGPCVLPDGGADGG